MDPPQPGRTSQSPLAGGGPPGLVHLVVAPLWYVLRPGTAGSVAVAARLSTYAVALSAWLLLMPAALAGIWVFERRLNDESWSEIWGAFASDGWLGTHPQLLLLVLGLTAGVLALLGWLYLPRVHVSGSGLASYGRAVRTVSLALPPLAALTLGSGSFAIAGSRAVGPPEEYVAALLFVLVPSAIASLLWWLGRAATAARGAQEPEPRPPLCEGCGYDLRHQPQDGRCPECNLGVAVSLVPGLRRRTIPWEQSADAEHWLATFREVLLRPRDFYSTARLKTPTAAAGRFAFWNYALIWAGAAAAATAALAYLSIRHEVGPEAGFFPVAVLMFSLCFTLGCWFGHRAVGAAAATWWIAKGHLPDYRWAEKVIAYESCFLWSFCLFWGSLAASFVVGEDWMSRLLGIRRFDPAQIGAPLEFYVAATGTLSLAVLWVRRYVIALGAIRWANF